jgi:hypothetical protein
MAKRKGRPPQGTGESEPQELRKYPRMAFTVRPTTKERLKAMSALQDRPLWKIVDDSINFYIAMLDPEEQKTIDAIVSGNGVSSLAEA